MLQPHLGETRASNGDFSERVLVDNLDRFCGEKNVEVLLA